MTTLTPDERTQMRRDLAEKLMEWELVSGGNAPKDAWYDNCAHWLIDVEDWQPDIDEAQSAMVREALRARWRKQPEGKRRWWEIEDCEEEGWIVIVREEHTGHFDDKDIVNEMADTLPEAICRAAWAAVKGEAAHD